MWLVGVSRKVATAPDTGRCGAACRSALVSRGHVWVNQVARHDRTLSDVLGQDRERLNGGASGRPPLYVVGVPESWEQGSNGSFKVADT